MRKVIVFFVVFIMMLFSYTIKAVNSDLNNNDYIEKDIVIDDDSLSNKYPIKINYNNEIIDNDLEDNVIGVVSSEMPASFNLEALKSMAVAARTFALYKINTNKDYVMKTTVSDQCYHSIEKMKSKWGSSFDSNYNKIKLAVDSTKHEYMTYKDEIIISFYFSISNGYTENCENVFSQKLDYLVSVNSNWDKEYSYKEQSKKISLSEFLSKLNIKSDSIKNINIERSSTNRINYITINGIKFKGSKFRSLLSLRSTDVDIKYDNEYVYIDTKGYGHGVGMSQYGANVMAKNGYLYDEILKYYYSGIKIMNKL